VNQSKKLVILGSTGSIGQQTLDIVRQFPDRFEVVGLACNSSMDLFRQQLAEFRPGFVSFSNFARQPVGVNRVSMDELAARPDADIVVIATTGKAGLSPALAALKAGKKVALANKEILVMAGELITRTAAEHHATILPVDSEHSAIWQCLRGEPTDVSRLLLTASGGPFFGKSRPQLAKVTAEEALNHPTWKMGKKVTIDSATLFNKGLEAIEAHWLFKIPYDRIEIIIHRQSIVHSMVEFPDGSVKAQMSMPDMHLPIQYALFYPDRVANSNITALNFTGPVTLSFEPVRLDDFPCLKVALEAAKKGGTYPAVICAADEVAVDLFLNKAINFTDIAKIIEETLNMHNPVFRPGLEEILLSDEWARETALEIARKAS
jgi:1-deoxy-D-xylulose-5-phosphate reductoisomerase